MQPSAASHRRHIAPNRSVPSGYGTARSCTRSNRPAGGGAVLEEAPALPTATEAAEPVTIGYHGVDACAGPGATRF